VSQSKVKHLDLPAITSGFVTHPAGRYWHVMRSAETQDVIGVSEARVSARRTEPLYTLVNGEKIIVTDRAQLKERPAEADGVLRVAEDGKSSWLWHKEAEKFLTQTAKNGWPDTAREIQNGWAARFNYRMELRGKKGEVVQQGLRPPQIGALHAIGAHWSLYDQAATVVMPTGTGKTETMLATLAAMARGCFLVVVPSRVLRDQTARKFATFGLLRVLENLDRAAPNPIVGVVTARPAPESELDILEKCNVVITTMSAIAEGAAASLGKAIAERVDTLIVDEAHHIGADGWAAFREHFTARRVLQFTATPFRRDGKLVDGKVIYSYPLQLAQRDGYFKKISFEPVYEIDDDVGDETIAAAAVKKLRSDMAAGLDHRLMARCANIDRARAVHKIYQDIARDLRPMLVHSESGDGSEDLENLKSGKSRIVVCVNMLGEGYDLPQLKVAAVHDTHKSLAVLLQFTGRFTRTANAAIGDATVVANIADGAVSSALERLYSEDADWNQLLSELSSDAAKAHAELIQFLSTSQRLDETHDDEKAEISHHLLRPKLSTVVYDASAFRPKRFFEGIAPGINVHRVWLHADSNTLYFVSRAEPAIEWTRSRELRNRQWDFFVLHWDKERKLLYLSSSDKTSMHEGLAKAVGAQTLISGDMIFRVLGRINRLIFQNVGVRKHGRRNLSYALYTGADVAEALSISERAGSVKSNLSGTGWEGGRPITVGCSYKGRVWSRDVGTVPEFVSWCETVGAKLQDGSIDTAQIIANVLIPEEVTSLPDKAVLSIEWPFELLRQAEERVVLNRGSEELPMLIFDLVLGKVDHGANAVDFAIVSADESVWGEFRLVVGGSDGFHVERLSKTGLGIRVGALENTIEGWLSNYPPMIRFMDLSELDGNLLIRPQHAEERVFPAERFEVWDWAGVDVEKESIWKNGVERQDSIQWRAAQNFVTGGFEIVFDDDSAGEAADLVCMKEEEDYIRLALIHCKFTKTASGVRTKDVVEVCSQAVRAAKWKWKFRDLCRHILAREKRLMRSGRATRFLSGNAASLNKFVKLSRFKEIRPEMVVVQPGLSRERHTPDQTAVLASAYSYLKETIGVDLDVICGA
jgi:superfamily II DNA or RNA helicase